MNTKRFHIDNDSCHIDPVTGVTENEEAFCLMYTSSNFPIKGNKVEALVASEYSSVIPSCVKEAMEDIGVKHLTTVANEIYSRRRVKDRIDEMIMQGDDPAVWLESKGRELLMKYEDSNPAVAANIYDKMLKMHQKYAPKAIDDDVANTADRLKSIFAKNRTLDKEKRLLNGTDK